MTAQEETGTFRVFIKKSLELCDFGSSLFKVVC